MIDVTRRAIGRCKPQAVNVPPSSPSTFQPSAGRERLLTALEVCDMAGVGKSWLYQAMRNGAFPLPVRIHSRMVRWRQSDVQAWIDSLGKEVKA